MSERPNLEQIGIWARTFFSDVKQGLEKGWNKVYGEYKEKYAQASAEQPVPRKRNPGLEDSETVVRHEGGAKKATKKAKK